MYPPVRRFTIGVAFLIALLSQAPAQEEKQPPKKNGLPKEDAPKRDADDYRLYFRKPVTVRDFWEAMHFEIDVGRYDLAARHLSGLLEKAADPDELLQIEDKEGMAPFLRLQNIPRWSDDAKVNAQARKDAQELLQRVTAALKEKLADPKRIGKFIKNLSDSREERDFALGELYRSGPSAIPLLLEALRTAEGEERLVIKSALPRMHDNTVSPLVAALDIDDPELRIDLIDILQKRRATEAVPRLWYLAGSAKQPEAVRKKATDALSYFLEIPASKLLPSKIALTREAERYYQHQASFADPEGVTVWRWDGKELKLARMRATQVEEYLGLRYAQQALDLDPSYQPAQVVLLSLALEKAVEQAGPDKPLAKAAPRVQELLATVNPDLVVAVLERALTDQRTYVILGAVRALGDLAEVRALKPTGRGEPGLVRALTYPDARVQMAAAETILRIPAPPSAVAAARIVEILRRNIAADPEVKAKSKVLVGFGGKELTNEVAQAVAGAGFEPVLVSTGREALRRLGEAGDIDAVLIDSALPDPGLAHLLGQFRADVNVGRLPLLVATVPDRAEARRLADRFREEIKQLHGRAIEERSQLEEDLRTLPERYRRERLRLEEIYKALPDHATADKRRFQEEINQIPDRALQEQKRLQASLDSLDERYKEETRSLERSLTERYSDASRRREESLRRLTEHYRNVWVVSGGLVLDSDWLKRTLAERFVAAGVQPLSEGERRLYAEISIYWLARMARGEVTGYDVQPAADAILNVARSGGWSAESFAFALQATGRLPGQKPQAQLAEVLLDERRPPPLRGVAAGELVRHIQKHGLLLSQVQIGALHDLLKTTDDATLKSSVALVLGSMRPDARMTGERLKGYTPAPPMPDKDKPPPDKDK